MSNQNFIFFIHDSNFHMERLGFLKSDATNYNSTVVFQI